MGLDMSIYVKQNGGEDSGYEYNQVAYWRKHPDLHGYIVNTFADGVDECQKIPLDEFKVQNIMAAIRNKSLPKTSGFFFGSSNGSESENDLMQLQEVLNAIKKGYKVYYQASW
jgi:hypothetical protein